MTLLQCSCLEKPTVWRLVSSHGVIVGLEEARHCHKNFQSGFAAGEPCLFSHLGFLFPVRAVSGLQEMPEPATPAASGLEKNLGRALFTFGPP